MNAPSPSSPARSWHMLRALKHRNFRLFFLGQLLSLLGSWMQNLAQGWLVWRMTHSSWKLGLVGFAQLAPVLVFGLLGGVAADRFNRHRIVLLTQSAALVQATLLAILTLRVSITLWQVLLLAAVLGLVNAFDMPGRQAFLVQMVGRQDLSNAIALNSSVFNGARVLGPALAGLVVGLWGEGACFAFNALSFLAVLVALLSMRLEPYQRAKLPGNPFTHILEGLRYGWQTPHVRALLALVTVTSLCALPYTVLMPAVVGGVLHRQASDLGIMMAFSGLGALGGALTVARRSGIRGLGRLTGWMAIGFGLSLMAFALSHSFALSCAVLVPVGYCMMTQMACTNTLLQSLVPEQLRGRLMSLYTITFVGVAPVGSMIQGRLATRLGVPTVLAVGGAITLLAGVIFRLLVPRLRDSVRALFSPPPTLEADTASESG